MTLTKEEFYQYIDAEMDLMNMTREYHILSDEFWDQIYNVFDIIRKGIKLDERAMEAGLPEDFLYQYWNDGIVETEEGKDIDTHAKLYAALGFEAASADKGSEDLDEED